MLTKAEERAYTMNEIRDIRLKKTIYMDTRDQQRREADALWLACCRAVDARDKFRCLACGRKCQRTLAAVPSRLERHHVIPVSLGGPDEPWNVISLCGSCHSDRHVTHDLGVWHSTKGRIRFERDGRTWTVSLKAAASGPGGRP